MNLDSVAHELYGLSPAEFTAARDAGAAEARKGGDPQLAAAIKKLRRPSVAAWLANMLARQRPTAVDDLLQIGDRLRQAQQRLAGAELKELARDGHRVVGDLVRDAERLAAFAGSRPSPSALRQLQETLDAALVDRSAADALRDGRLTFPLSYAGLGDPVEAAGEGRANPGSMTETDETRRERDLGELSSAEARVAELTAELQSAQRRHGRMQEQIEVVERQLQQARAQETQAAQEIQGLRAALDAASGAAEDMRRRIGAGGLT